MIRLALSIAFSLSFAAAVLAQNTNPDSSAAQSPAQPHGDWQGQRGPHGAWGGRGGLGAGDGIVGTVTEVAADHYTIKNDAGQTYKISFSANTRILRQLPRKPGTGSDERGTPPQPIKSSDIKVGDAIIAAGEVDTAAKSVGAVVVIGIDPERARQFRQMQANYGKTWLAGKVTAIHDTSITLMGSVDSVAHTVQADENTTFRKHREPVTLADVQLGDMVRVEGALKDGGFVAASISVMGPPQGGDRGGPRDARPAPQQ